jgi:hypothetical protein
LSFYRRRIRLTARLAALLEPVEQRHDLAAVTAPGTYFGTSLGLIIVAIASSPTFLGRRQPQKLSASIAASKPTASRKTPIRHFQNRRR